MATGSISAIMEQHDKEKEEKTKLTGKEKARLKKLEKKLAKEAKIRRSQEQKMEIETTVAEKIISTYRRKWKEIQMEKGRPEYKEYMMEHWSLFDHMMDNKDKLIEVYQEELLHAERTRKKTYIDHLLSTESLFKNFYRTIEYFKVTMDKEKENLLARRNATVKQFKTDAARKDENMRLTLYLVEQKRITDTEIMDADFLFQRDEETSKNRSEIELLVTRIQAKMMALWKEYKSILENHAAYTSTILKRSEPLVAKVSQDDQIILQQEKKLKNMRYLIEIAKYRSQKEPRSAELRDLRAERAELYNTYIYQKKIHADMEKKNMEQITGMLNVIDNVNKHFLSAIKFGESILKTHVLCVRLETKKEQNTLVKDELTYQRIYNIPTFKTFKFWKRIQRVELLRKVLHFKCRSLKKHNKFLRHRLGSVFSNGQIKNLLQDITRCSQQFG